MENEDDLRAAILRRFESVDQLSYEDKDALAEWLAEPEDMDYIRYSVGRSNLEVVARMQVDGLRGQIQIVRALRTLSTAQYDGQRRLEEAQKKMSEVRAMLSKHTLNDLHGDELLKTLDIAMDILNVLDRPDDPWDADATE